MKRYVIGAAIAGTVLLGPAALTAQAGEQHHPKVTHQQSKPAKHHGHKDCACTPKPHKPGHVSCKPNCLGHGPKPCPPTKPPVKYHPHKPHHPKPKPPHHHHPKPPVKPPVKPPTVTPHPPIITPPVHHRQPVVHRPRSHVGGHAKPPVAQLAFTGPAQYAVIGGTAAVFLVVGGGLILLTRGPARYTKAAKENQR